MPKALKQTSAQRSTRAAKGTEEPLLWQGQRLSQKEFHRRYSLMPHLKKAQLVEGIVHMPSPLRYRQHDEPQTVIMGWITYYATFTPGVRPGGSATLKIDSSNEYQPDGMLFFDQGQLIIDDDGYLVGVPEFVVEVSASTVTIDSGPKYEVYQKHGVKEYLHWITTENVIHWYESLQNKFVLQTPGRDGLLKSNVFPGLWLDVKAMLKRDSKAVLAALQKGIASKEHQQFVKHKS